MAEPAPTTTGAETTALQYLQQALEDLDHAREKASDDARERIDAAIERISSTVKDIRSRAEHTADEWERVLERSTEEIRREWAVRAIHAQQTDAALTVLSREIRHRRAELAARDA